MIRVSKLSKIENPNKNLQPKIPDSHQQKYSIYFDDQNIYITYDYQPEFFMKIDRQTTGTQIKQLTPDIKQQISILKSSKFYVIFGKVTFKKIDFLVVIQKAAHICTLFDKKIYKVLSVQFLSIKKDQYDSKEYEKCYNHIYKLKTILKQGFYFSYEYPLHQQFNEQIIKSQCGLDKNIFVWNYQALKHLCDLTYINFFTPLIQGYVGEIKNKLSNFYLISRRSCIMGGTRYNSRGCDNNGFVANYVESEQIFEINKKIFTYIQIRGSLPFFWSQKGVSAKIQVNQTLSQNYTVLKSHLNFLEKKYNYKKLIFFNLLGVNRGDEGKLTNELLDLLQQARKDSIDNIEYCHVDFHAITKETDFSPMNEHILNITENNKFNIFEYQDQNLKKTQQQEKVIRTNCMDCLDRTNAAQTKISFEILTQILKEEKIDIFDDNFFDWQCLVYLEKSKNQDIDKFRLMWADNGDIIAKIYAGTGATTSSVTRKGEKSGITSIFDHGLKTISRFYLNNFEDDYKQEIIDQMLNKKQTTIRQSILQLEQQQHKSFPLGVISLISCKKNEMLEISLESLKSIFIKMQSTDFFIFLFYNHNSTNIRIKAKDYHVYKNFNEVFTTFSPIFGDFEQLVQFNEKNFEIFLMGKKDCKKDLDFFDSKKTKLSMFQKSLGLQVSFILKKTSIEIFPLVLEKGKQKNEEYIQKILKKMDKIYDVIFVLGNLDENVDLQNAHPNYDHVYETTVVSKKTGFNNQITILCSKNLVEQNLVPMQQQIDIDTIDLSEDFTLNSQIFILFGHDNQL